MAAFVGGAGALAVIHNAQTLDLRVSHTLQDQVILPIL